MPTRKTELPLLIHMEMHRFTHVTINTRWGVGGAFTSAESAGLHERAILPEAKLGPPTYGFSRILLEKGEHLPIK